MRVSLKFLCGLLAAFTLSLASCSKFGSLHSDLKCPANFNGNQGRYLIVETLGGLGNRLNNLASGYVMAKLTQRTLVLDWQLSKNETPAYFNDLFENYIPSLDSIQMPDGCIRQSTRDIEKSGYIKVYDITKDAYRSFAEIPNDNTQVILVRNWFSYAPLPEFMSFSEYMREFTGFLKSLRPVPSIAAEVRAFWENKLRGQHPLVGVHYRSWTLSADFKTLVNANLDDFIVAMERQIDRDRHTKFFVASSDPQVARRLQRHFAPRVFTMPVKKVERANADDLKQSLVEWLLLTKTDFMLGTFDSTFSTTAAALTKHQGLFSVGPRVFQQIGGAYCSDDRGKLVKRDLSCLMNCCETFFTSIVGDPLPLGG